LPLTAGSGRVIAVKSEDLKRYRWRLLVYMVALAGGLVADAHTPYGSAEWLIGLLLVSIAVVVGDIPEMLLVAGAVALCVMAGLWLSPAGRIPFWLEVANRVGGLIVVAVAVWVARRRRIAERELRVLQGLLPICAACKKIRNEEDQWESLERYISHRSEAKFTHSLCPECFERYHSEIK
jgi:hypothetical protein